MKNYFFLEALLDTEEGMEATVRSGSKNDDGTDAIAGAEWFLFDGAAAATVYISGNNWIGLGASSAQLNVCNRDGATYTILRQEGRLNGWRFLKVRVKGYTYYSSTAVQYALTYELFLFENGSMFLNVIATPTNTSYLGTSSLVCGGATTALTITAPTQISFYPGDAEGKSWNVKDETIRLPMAYDTRWLLRAGGKLYTVADGAPLELAEAQPTAALFRTQGLTQALPSSALQSLGAAQVLFWMDTQEVSPAEFSGVVRGLPVPQDVVTDNISMAYGSVKGVRGAAIDASDDVRFAISFDEGGTWKVHDSTVWVEDADGAGMDAAAFRAITQTQWAQAATTGHYLLRWRLPGAGSYMKSAVINYVN